MEFIKKIINSDFYQKSLPYIVLTIGFLCFLFSIFGDFEQNSPWKEFWKGIGSAALSGGFFGVLLKSIQYMGVFKEELTKVIFETKHLENRHDLHDFWEKVSLVMFKFRFSKISKLILQDIKDTYLPVKTVNYYENYKHNIIIEKIENNFVYIKQSVKFTLYTTGIEEKFNYPFINKIEYGSDKSNASLKVTKLMINGNKHIPDLNQTHENGVLVSSFDIPMEGNEKYEIERVVEKKYNLEYDNIINFVCRNITYKMNIKFHIPVNVSIDFHSCGTVNQFSTEQNLDNYLEKSYDGVLYPNQGYFAVIKLKQ